MKKHKKNKPAPKVIKPINDFKTCEICKKNEAPWVFSLQKYVCKDCRPNQIYLKYFAPILFILTTTGIIYLIEKL